MSGPGGSVGVPSISMGGVDAGDNSTDGRKAKRELSQSKRAAQNRAAQRAFRQRKEGYIKKLEQQVRDYAAMENNFKEMQQENYAMKEYIIHLQSQLLESHGEFPQPPPNVNLQHHQAHAHAHHHAPPPPPSGINAPDPVGQPQSAPPPANSLEVAAQAVAGLSRSEHIVAARDHHYAGKVYEQQAVAARADDDDRTAEEITRQLQADGAPDSLPAVPM
ncbi:hypothetical protein B0T17DRAFT_486055 [Bombardia bombarda]|uniref:Putative transcription factor kapC n=1 Tax=Bombardia bombarda TaxID=252184 RepID=A0AA40CG91_9PEZI|nr:hypothetical protein B0T17DRAFT_486055 [Bombardia bombarda]